jgi:DNA-binding GntR family transcriptional regulator
MLEVMTPAAAPAASRAATAELSLDLDRSSPVPLWFQAAQQLQAAIDRGDLRPGQRLDNEVELATRFGLSRPTLRKAIEQLVGQGLLVRKRGVGTQVVQSQVRRPVELSSLFDDLAGSGRRPSTRVLSCQEVPADETVAAALGVPLGEPVTSVERIRSADGEPLAMLRNWLPKDVGELTPAALTEHGLYDVLRRHGVHLRIANQRISAAVADAAQARLLGTRKAAPLLTMERTSYDDTGRAVELGRHLYRADGYSFEITVVGR